MKEVALPGGDLDGGHPRLDFASEPGRIRSSVITLNNVDGRVIVAEGARFLVVPRAIAFEDSIYIDTALVRRGQRQVAIADRAFTLQASAALLRLHHISFQEGALERADTFALRVDSGAELMLSGATPFYISGNGPIRGLRIGGLGLGWWGTSSDTMQLVATIRRPRVFFLSLRGAATFAHASLSIRPQDGGTTLVLEDAPEIFIDFRQREPGWAFIAPTIVPNSATLPALGTTDTAQRSPLEVLEVSGFKNAQFRNQPRATLVIGAERDTIGFVHRFEVTGARDAYLRYARSEGTRFEGAADNAAVNGENRVATRANAVPGEVLGGLIIALAAAMGFLVKALFQLEKQPD